ncbi:MAG: hypothetical protein F4Y39_20845 [Gemmatimonadetes bacterium]|nr:hypothetical protein [Gemmatimonadota bacterium]MYF73693.1 hypothetical protein [Gemmatimonadota bacterium]MYK53311.1 hypothetical protein [Gemmatimonadota bacterium]
MNWSRSKQIDCERRNIKNEGAFARLYAPTARSSPRWPSPGASVKWLAPDNFDKQGKQRVRLSDLTRPILKKTD